MTSKRTKKDIQPHVFFDNYDYGGGEPSATSPGGGLWMNQNKYKSTGDFLQQQRKKRKKLLKKVKAGILQHIDMGLVVQADALDGRDIFPKDLMDVNHLMAPMDDNVIFVDAPEAEEKHSKPIGKDIEVSLDDEEPSFSFVLDRVPGGDDQDDVPADIEVDEPEEQEVEVEKDPWKWSLGPGFYDWLKERQAAIPRHSGKDLAGVERAISYLDKFRKEVRSAARSDVNDQLNIKIVEEVLEELHKGIEGLTERRDALEKHKYHSKKKTKRAEAIQGLVRTAGTIPGISGIVVAVPLLISSLARSCINGMISGGKDIERVYANLAAEYSLSKREKLELLQCLSDSGYDVRRDLGVSLDQEIDTRSEDNVNWAANYPA